MQDRLAVRRMVFAGSRMFTLASPLTTIQSF